MKKDEPKPNVLNSKLNGIWIISDNYYKLKGKALNDHIKGRGWCFLQGPGEDAHFWKIGTK